VKLLYNLIREKSNNTVREGIRLLVGLLEVKMDVKWNSCLSVCDQLLDARYLTEFLKLLNPKL